MRISYFTDSPADIRVSVGRLTRVPSALWPQRRVDRRCRSSSTGRARSGSSTRRPRSPSSVVCIAGLARQESRSRHALARRGPRGRVGVSASASPWWCSVPPCPSRATSAGRHGLRPPPALEGGLAGHGRAAFRAPCRWTPWCRRDVRRPRRLAAEGGPPGVVPARRRRHRPAVRAVSGRFVPGGSPRRRPPSCGTPGSWSGSRSANGQPLPATRSCHGSCSPRGACVTIRGSGRPGPRLVLSAAAVRRTGSPQCWSRCVSWAARRRVRAATSGRRGSGGQRPWLVPALTLDSQVDLAGDSGFAAFHAPAESPLGLVASAISLGGIWKKSVVPAERTTVVVGAAPAVFALTALGALLRSRTQTRLRNSLLLVAVVEHRASCPRCPPRRLDVLSCGGARGSPSCATRTATSRPWRCRCPSGWPTSVEAGRRGGSGREGLARRRAAGRRPGAPAAERGVGTRRGTCARPTSRGTGSPWPTSSRGPPGPRSCCPGRAATAVRMERRPGLPGPGAPRASRRGAHRRPHRASRGDPAGGGPAQPGGDRGAGARQTPPRHSGPRGALGRGREACRRRGSTRRAVVHDGRLALVDHDADAAQAACPEATRPDAPADLGIVTVSLLVFMLDLDAVAALQTRHVTGANRRSFATIS